MSSGRRSGVRAVSAIAATGAAVGGLVAHFSGCGVLTGRGPGAPSGLVTAPPATQPVHAPAGIPPSGDDGNYFLPFAEGTTYWVGQGNFGVIGLGSHSGQYAIDFIMPEGTRILAARGGRVVGVREDCPNVSCPFSPDTCCGNYVKIAHADGTLGAYWHLPENGSCVRVGDEVARGDVIAVSGNTGISLTPHLHFAVYASKGQVGTGRLGPSDDGSNEVVFVEIAGDGVPQFMTGYTSANGVNRDWCR